MNLEKATDGELISQFSKAGDEVAYEELVRRHLGMVFRLCRRITGNAHDAEDSTQAVFAILAQRASELTEHRTLGGWLYSTAWHTASHERRARTRRRQREQTAATSARASFKRKPVTLERDELHQELYRALEMLPPDYRTAIVLHHLEGLRIEELADITGEPIGTVAARLSRGRAMIRERLARRDTPLSAINLVIFFENEIRGVYSDPSDDAQIGTLQPSPDAAALPVASSAPAKPACGYGVAGAVEASTTAAAGSSASTGPMAGATRILAGLLQGRAAIAIITLCVISGGASAASPTTRQWIASATSWVREIAVRDKAKAPRTPAPLIRDNAELADVPGSFGGAGQGMVPEPATACIAVALVACVVLRRPSRPQG
jgi:RNA polymerase sigma factor (sigma-70 family)